MVMPPAPVLVERALSGGASAAFQGVAAALMAAMMAEAVVLPGLMRTVRTFVVAFQSTRALVPATEASPTMRTDEPFNCDAVARLVGLEVRTKSLLSPPGMIQTDALEEPLTPPPATRLEVVTTPAPVLPEAPLSGVPRTASSGEAAPSAFTALRMARAVVVPLLMRTASNRAVAS